jgi:hypothetical protein
MGIKTMREIDKLRQRLKNVKREVVEYRMTVIEANALVGEFTALEKKLLEIPLPQPIIEPMPINITRIIDGGSF